MTNFQIITNEAISAGLYTEEQVEEIFASGHSLPLHTFKEWQRLGYKIRKGEHAKLTCFIWRFKNKKGVYQQGETRWRLMKATSTRPRPISLTIRKLSEWQWRK